MKMEHPIINRIASMIVAAAFMIIGLLLMMLGVTFLPVFGIIMALPLMGISLHFLTLDIEVKTAVERSRPVVYVEGHDYCPWPPVSCCEEAAWCAWPQFIFGNETAREVLGLNY